MKIKLTMLASLVLASLLVTGCKTGSSVLSPALVQSGVAAGVSYGCQKYPQAVPGVRIAGEVVCSAATGTNLSPAAVVAQIQVMQPDMSAETALIVNTSLLLYTGVWNSYGSDAVANNDKLREYLQATCNGINAGLPSALARKPIDLSAWPMVR